MAKVYMPAHAERALGSVGKVTFSEAKSGSTARSRVNPAQPRTADQLTVRANLAIISQTWQTLSDAQRESWNDYAAAHPVSNAFGEQVTLSGFNVYSQCNMRLQTAGQTLIDDAPTTAAPSNVAAFNATGGAGSVSLAFTAASGTDTSLAIRLVGPQSVGIKADIRKANLVGYYPAETQPISITSLAPGFYTVYYNTMDELSGLVSPTQSDTFTVT